MATATSPSHEAEADRGKKRKEEGPEGPHQFHGVPPSLPPGQHQQRYTHPPHPHSYSNGMPPQQSGGPHFMGQPPPAWAGGPSGGYRGPPPQSHHAHWQQQPPPQPQQPQQQTGPHGGYGPPRGMPMDSRGYYRETGSRKKGKTDGWGRSWPARGQAPPPGYGQPRPSGYGGPPQRMPPTYASQGTWTGRSPPRYENMDVSYVPSPAAPTDDDGASSSAGGSNKGRGSYKCGKCGVPKKGHICPYQPKIRRRTDEDPPELRNAAIQVEMDEFMTLRRLNIRIQGYPESYTAEPYSGATLAVSDPTARAYMQHPHGPPHHPQTLRPPEIAALNHPETHVSDPARGSTPNSQSVGVGDGPLITTSVKMEKVEKDEEEEKKSPEK